MRNLAQQTYQKQAESGEAEAFARLVRTYDLGIVAGIRKDKAQAERVLALLLSTLDPLPNPELALSLRAIYDDCASQLESDNFAAYTESMERLKGLWTAYFTLRKSLKTP